MAIKFYVTLQFSNVDDFSVIAETVTLGVYACRAYPVKIGDPTTEGGGAVLLSNRRQRLKFILEVFQLTREPAVDAPPTDQDYGDYLEFMRCDRLYNYLRISASNCLAFVNYPTTFPLPRPVPAVVSGTIEPEPNDEEASDYVTIELLESEPYEGL